MNPLRYLEKRIRGWLPKEPSVPSPQKTKLAKIKKREVTEWERKAFNIARIVNVIILGTFLGLHFLIDPFNKNVGLTVASWIVFVLSLFSVNFLLYRYSKKRANNQMEESQQ